MYCIGALSHSCLVFPFSDVKMLPSCGKAACNDEGKGDVVVHVDPTPWKANFEIYQDGTLVEDYAKFVYGADRNR